MKTCIPASPSSFIALTCDFVGSIVSQKSAHPVAKKPCELTDKKGIYSQFLEKVQIMLQLCETIIRYEIASARREVIAVVRLVHDAFYEKLA